MSEAIKVICRFRGGQDSEDRWIFGADGISVKSPAGKRSEKDYVFDRVLNSDSSQAVAYLEGGRPSVRALLAGFNGTIFAYG